MGLRLLRPIGVLALNALAWWAIMFWPLPDATVYPPGAPKLGHDVSYGRPWKFGIDMNDVASDAPGNIDIWKWEFFLLDGLIWAAVLGGGSAVLLWIARTANPNR